MPTVELSNGSIEYLDTGGDGAVIVFAHGPPMDFRQWRKVLPLLPEFRCIAPTLPMGGHHRAMNSDADLSQLGMARLVAELLDHLNLTEVTLVLNDWGGGQFMISDNRAQRVARMALVACEAFDNFPPGAGKILPTAGRIPGGMWLLVQLMRFKLFRQMRAGYGGMSLSGLPDGLLKDWFTPARKDPDIRRDLTKFAIGTPDATTLRRWFDSIGRTFDRPVLIVWADRDVMMPAEHGPQLAALYSNSHLVQLTDSSTLIPEDQPEQLAELLRDFCCP